MTPQQFHHWRTQHGLTQENLAEALGIPPADVDLYEQVEHPAEIPKTVRLAMWALAQGRDDYEGAC